MQSFSAKKVQTDTEPLGQIYAQNHAHNPVTPSYIGMTLFYLLLLLGLFYVVIQFVAAQQRTKKSPDNAQSLPNHLARFKTLFKRLVPTLNLAGQGVCPAIVSRTRFSPSKDIYVLDIAEKRLVVGMTAQSMTLLCELPQSFNVPTGQQPASTSPMHTSGELLSVPEPRQSLKEPSVQTIKAAPDIYKKYLSVAEIEAVPVENTHAAIPVEPPEEAEVTVLKDYADRFEEYF